MCGPCRWFLCAVAAVSILLGALAARPDWATHGGLDLCDSLETRRQAERRRQELSEVEKGLGRVDERARCREQVAAAVHQRRMRLLEAAAHFRRLNADDEAGLYQRLYCAGDSEDERCCRQVIGWVQSQLRRESPEEAARRTAELEQELTDYLHRDGRGRPAPFEGEGASARPKAVSHPVNPG
jgi:hypothetical protein